MTEKLKKLISRTGTTLYAALLAVYNILLSKYSGQHDIVVGTGTAGRKHADLENIIGFFVNMLAIRNPPAPTKTFNEFLKEVEKNTLNAYENQDYQFEELIKKLHLQGTLARNPLIDTVFHLQDIQYPELQIKGLKLKNYQNENNTTRFDLITYAADQGDTIDMRVSYSTGLFKPSTAAGISRNYLEVLDQVTDNKNIKLEDITISSHLLEAQSDIFKEDQSDFGFDQ